MSAPKFVQQAEALMLHAELLAGDGRRDAYLEAKDLLLRAERLAPGSGAYAMACVSARLGDSTLCEKWLERAERWGTLPARAVLTASPYLAAVRDERWFKKFLNRVKT